MLYNILELKSLRAMDLPSLLYKVLNCYVNLISNLNFSESVFKIKKFAASDNSANQIEQVIKYVLIQTPFILKRQKESTIHTTIVEQS